MRIPGVGKKTAERMVLELKDKLDLAGLPARTDAAAAKPAYSAIEEDVISALINLGYQRPLAEKALSRMGTGTGESFDGLFRKALAVLAK